MDLSQGFAGLKGSPQEKKEAIKQQVSSEIAMANVSAALEEAHTSQQQRQRLITL
jgi:hypothetical protein